MSKVLVDKYLELKEQAEYFDFDLDFETLELIPKQPRVKRTWLDAYKDKVADGDDGAESSFEAWA